jgi:hypothetical protein
MNMNRRALLNIREHASWTLRFALSVLQIFAIASYYVRFAP